ncbi:hypothetical protein ACNKHP_00800 [Shigella boydii]
MLLMGWQKFTQQRPHAPTDHTEALQTEGQFDYAASLVKSLASLLVVTSGSAIGREVRDDLFQLPLPPPVSPNVLRHARQWKLWIAWAPRRNGLRPIVPRLLAVYL